MLADDDVQFWKYDRFHVTSSRFPQIFQNSGRTFQILGPRIVT